jgi:hypothetical protein
MIAAARYGVESPMRRATPPLVALMVAMLSLLGVANADPHVRLTVRSTCPSPQQVETAFAAENLTTRTGPRTGWHVRVSDEADGAALQVTRADGTARQERRIRSTDCVAMAEAFALIAASHLRAHATSRGPAPVASKPRTAMRDRTAPESPPTVYGGGGPGASPPGLRRAARTLTWAIGYQLGYESTLAPNTTGLSHHTHVAVTRPDRWGAIAAFRRTGARDLHMELAPAIERSETSGALLLTRMFSRDQVWLTPAAGAGFALSQVADVGDATVRRLHPTVNGSVVAGLRITRWASLRGELSGQLFPIADTYSTTDDGVVGESPRATVSLGLGIQLSPRGW